MLIFTFPGQGSQRPGMGNAWRAHPSWEVAVELAEASGRPLEHLLCDADADELTRTDNAQLATFAASLVALDGIERLGLEASLVIGHSLGEYSALVAAGALGLGDGGRLVAARGDAMVAAAQATPGTMAAVMGLDDDSVEIACSRAEGGAWVANYNAPGQVVISGTYEGVERASVLAKEMGAKRVMSFPIAGGFHSPLMEPAREHLRRALADARFEDAAMPVVANIDARVHERAEDWPALLSAQLCSPVRFRQSVELVSATYPEPLIFVEVGPGGVLTGLVRRIAPSARTISVAQPDDLDRLLEVLDEGHFFEEYHSAHQGEALYTSERVVVSPCTGLFDPAVLEGGGDFGELASLPGAGAGPIGAIAAGAVIGLVGEREVRSPFTGTVLGWLAHRGERVLEGQPLAWLRVEEDR
jgi:[acyl-carrier-protein] S-malonyltransferase